ncbi:MAG: hypothetical protein SPK04_08550 [Succinivibrionaceae bacterium]|nr:hypothetical protein [Succinivibrionaceae bacterium]
MADNYKLEYHIRKNGKLCKFGSMDQLANALGDNIIDALREAQIEHLKEFSILKQINNSILNQLYQISDILLYSKDIQLYQKYNDGIAAFYTYITFNCNDSKRLEDAHQNMLSAIFELFHSIEPINIHVNNYIEIINKISSARNCLIGILIINKDFTEEEKKNKLTDFINNYRKLLDSLEEHLLRSLVNPFFSPYQPYIPCQPIEIDPNYYSIKHYNYNQNLYTSYLVYMKEAFTECLSAPNRYNIKLQLYPQEQILYWIDYEREFINDFCHPVSQNNTLDYVEEVLVDE